MALAKTDTHINQSAAFVPRFMGASVLILSAVALTATPATAQNNKHSCTIIVDNTPGQMRQNATTTVLSSQQAGGMAARAEIIATNSSYRISIDNPSGFRIFPNGGNNNTQFSASFSATGSTSFFSVPAGVEEKIKKGSSNIEVHMQASRLNGSFPSGTYAATVTLRCE